MGSSNRTPVTKHQPLFSCTGMMCYDVNKYLCALLASKPQWKSRPQRKRLRSGNDNDDDDGGGTENDTPVQTRKDSNLGFVTAKDQYVSILNYVYCA